MTTSRAFLLSPVLAAALAAAGCATAPEVATDVPASLRPASTQALYLEVLAAGVQIYECAARPDQPDAFAWTFRAPEAGLVDRTGHTIGKHYAGPTWEMQDGSTVVGEVKSRDPGPDPGAIPWLLLSAKATSNTGLLANTKSIQRVRTAGGVAPTRNCDATVAKQVVRVPYSATYYFYR